MSILITSIKTILASVVLLGLALLVVFFLFNCKEDWCYVFQWQKFRMVNNFEECVAFSFPVSTSSPRQCKAGDRSFVELLNTADDYGNLIQAINPNPNSLIKSPLNIKGQARGSWYFEASFPIRLIDANGKEIARSTAQAKSDWMTNDFVPFESTIIFSNPATDNGTLVLENDNPSGLPQNSKSISIPVRFETIPDVSYAGRLEGFMNLGPICPVERIDNPCKPTPEMFAVQKVFIYLSDKKTLVVTLIPNAEGRFGASLTEGDYWLYMKPSGAGSITGAPTSFHIKANTNTTLTISVDTGIR